MALTASQKESVRFYLGYTDTDRGLYSRLEGAMDVLSAEAEARIGTILTDLAALETRLRTDVGMHRVTRAEDVHLAEGAGQRTLFRRGHRLVNNLSTLLGVEVFRYPFTPAPSSGVARRG